ncbi:hypothetical protein [uncultured Sulfitobacter sp.]|uniref:c-type cytochrome n=1 Tax=uncultured Sulfitobacter sp. TaxID=191468 RepID=UPI002623807D|nr:hypothetical protein [uncultured Sulfitobacter sp.]
MNSYDEVQFPAPWHDVSCQTWHHDNTMLFEYTKQGRQAALAAMGVTGFNSGMPAFDGKILDDEIWDILAYIRSIWPERERDVQAGRNPPHQNARRLNPHQPLTLQLLEALSAI